MCTVCVCLRKWGRFYHIHTLNLNCIMRNGENVNGKNRLTHTRAEREREKWKWEWQMVLPFDAFLLFSLQFLSLFVYLKSTLSLYALSICSYFHSIWWSKCVCVSTLCATILSPSIFIVITFSVLFFFSWSFNSFACLPVTLYNHTLPYDISAKHQTIFVNSHHTYDNVI